MAISGVTNSFASALASAMGETDAPVSETVTPAPGEQHGAVTEFTNASDLPAYENITKFEGLEGGDIKVYYHQDGNDLVGVVKKGHGDAYDKVVDYNFLSYWVAKGYNLATTQGDLPQLQPGMTFSADGNNNSNIRLDWTDSKGKSQKVIVSSDLNPDLFKTVKDMQGRSDALKKLQSDPRVRQHGDVPPFITTPYVNPGTDPLPNDFKTYTRIEEVDPVNHVLVVGYADSHHTFHENLVSKEYTPELYDRLAGYIPTMKGADDLAHWLKETTHKNAYIVKDDSWKLPVMTISGGRVPTTTHPPVQRIPSDAPGAASLGNDAVIVKQNNGESLVILRKIVGDETFNGLLAIAK